VFSFIVYFSWPRSSLPGLFLQQIASLLLYCSAEQVEHLEQFGAGVLGWVYTLDDYPVITLWLFDGYSLFNH